MTKNDAERVVCCFKKHCMIILIQIDDNLLLDITFHLLFNRLPNFHQAIIHIPIQIKNLWIQPNRLKFIVLLTINILHYKWIWKQINLLIKTNLFIIDNMLRPLKPCSQINLIRITLHYRILLFESNGSYDRHVGFTFAFSKYFYFGHNFAIF